MPAPLYALLLAAVVFAVAVASAGVAAGPTNGNDPYPDPHCPHPKPAAEPVDGPGTFHATWLTEAAKSDNAVCIDGSTPVVYIRAGNGTGSRKWLVHHEGGGWCNDPYGCLARSGTPLGSTVNDTPTIEMHTYYFAYWPSLNPFFYNWNMAYLRYCDGGSFSGSNATALVVKGQKLWFRGWHILNAAIDELVNHQGMDQATDVVISGCSAGGLAAYLHADHWAQRLRQSLRTPNARVKAMPDSGFFLDNDGPPKYEDRVKAVFAMQNNTAGMPASCVQRYPAAEAWRCFFAENVAPTLGTPTFPLQSRFDTWQIGSDLGTNDTAAVNQWGDRLVATLTARLLNTSQQHGVFLDSCAHHCENWGGIHIDGEDAPHAFNDWFEGTTSRRVWFQNETYPCATCCNNPPPPAPVPPPSPTAL